MSRSGTIPDRIAWLEAEIADLKRRATLPVGLPPSPHSPNHEDGGSDSLDVTALAGFPGDPDVFLNGDGAFTTPPSSGGDVTGPGASTDQAIARWSGTGGDTLQDSGVLIDDYGVLTPAGVHIPLFNAGNSGASITLDWNNSNEQLLTLTDDAVVTLDNPRDGGRYVLLLKQDGTGGWVPTLPANVLWPGGTPPTITPDPDVYDLITMIYLAGEDVYLAATSQNYLVPGT